ncbi:MULTISPECIES: bifunctional glycosyltransferase/CDP-glycerol:glycerophosphate glycerophosphotransferase [Streptomycetaceae]|uniref:CDP-glycerol:poly(Glycerophosphate) glycerophosphotransferase n=1 Tax=Streptantibioticus cattleyicolor (strain ATCC 35852 / DSM 46488 / JCM 4925 / NBRC 14057 / NRRL 8057) TaxID=1003195 RepID=F8JUF3_STREN|nr:bifunctional glycosyltransferase family 2 protein/CDP-glycerol:glycerophosphate glycerophosphotransferase [Streptantibioticus cattleyicolor]AEW94363.1 CDP-glycerol:poly(glycerophosphate) glycerophosphotransferase [Streptantibioticus cattleyicolor NRRL 8057 = DSM 46488]MYS59013.1 glycosyltransferase [Streptomyces sp. SID5468]CCB74721.1 putative glycosyltransferase [Streptantibioticus cattleyicolor NRRL 8057 = DSM 46488]
MPRFSVIVPAFKVQAYLPEALQSVLTQSYRDVEVIAVDDHSPDHCGRIIDEAAADPRVVPVHLPENAGLGAARNAGIDRARGDYLLFLDGDDTLTPGALRAVADRLAATGDPDVLVYDYARTYWNGDVQRNALARLLAEEEPPVFTVAQRPEFLRLLMIACNKAYRRDFIARLGLAFPPGYYEDTPWSYPTLLAAGSVAVLDRVCLHYRQRRRGNILGTTSRCHFDIFDQYDRVFAFVGARAGLGVWRPLLFQRMLDHLTTVLAAPDRLPPDARAEFFRRCRAQYRRYRPLADRARPELLAAVAEGTVAPGAVPAPGRRARLRYLLMRLGARRTFRLMWSADRARGRLRAAGRRGYALARAALLQLHYRVQRLRPLDADLAVFAAYWHRGYACNPAAIEAAVREHAPHIRTAWITGPEYAHTLPPGVRRLHPGSAAYWTALARAGYLVNNVNFTHRLVKRPGQVHLQTHHGTPLKRMGLDLQAYPAAAAGVDFGRLLRHADRWDYSLSANRHSTLVWERVYPARFTTLEFGYPRNDILHRATADDVLRVRAELEIPPGTTAILYAPTHRDYRRTPPEAPDLARLARALGPGFTLLTRAHYFHRPFPAADADGDAATVLDVSAHPRVEELYLAADGLLTDYSSVMFDYANLDRPIVVAACDWEAYRAARGTYLDITRHAPGPVARTEEELIAVFTSGEWCGAESARRRAAFRARFCPYDDGHAAERVVRRVFLGEHRRMTDELSPLVVPLADRTPPPAARAAAAPAAVSVRTAAAAPTDAEGAVPPPTSRPCAPEVS